MIKIQDLCLSVSGFNCTWRAHKPFIASNWCPCTVFTRLHGILLSWISTRSTGSLLTLISNSRTNSKKVFLHVIWSEWLTWKAGIRDYLRMLHSVRSDPRVWQAMQSAKRNTLHHRTLVLQPTDEIIRRNKTYAEGVSQICSAIKIILARTLSPKS